MQNIYQNLQQAQFLQQVNPSSSMPLLNNMVNSIQKNNDNKQKFKIIVKQQQNEKFSMYGQNNIPMLYFLDFERKLGEGHFGQVFKAYNYNYPDLQLAVKCIEISKMSNKQNYNETLKNEINVLKILSEISEKNQNNPHFVKHYDQCISKDSLYIFMEYCNGGDLLQFLRQRLILTEEETWRFLKQICQACCLLHKNNIIHRDLKLNNILIHNGIYKVGDPGIALILGSQFQQSKEQMIQISTTTFPIYISPEAKNGILTVDGKSIFSKQLFQTIILGDVWSLGVIAYSLLYGRKNRDDYIQMYIQEKTINNQTQLKFPQYPPRSKKIQILLQQMLEYDFGQRITCQQALENFPMELSVSLKQINVLLNNECMIDELMNNLSEFMGKCFTQVILNNDQSQQSSQDALIQQFGIKQENTVITNINDIEQLKQTLQMLKKRSDMVEQNEAILLYFSRIFLYHREVYHFMSRVILIVDEIQDLLQSQCQIENELYLKLLFAISKTQINYINGIQEKIKNSPLQFLDSLRWKIFIEGPHFQQVQKLYSKDLQKITQRYQLINQTILNFISNQKNKEDFQWFYIYSNINQMNNENGFYNFTQQILRQVIQKISNNQGNLQNRTLLLIIRYLLVCYNADLEFNRFLLDPNPLLKIFQFIEENEQLKDSAQLLNDVLMKSQSLV